MAPTDTALEKLNSSILVTHSTPLKFFEELSHKYTIKAVYANEDYELSAQKRDSEIEKLLNAKGIQWHSYKD